MGQTPGVCAVLPSVPVGHDSSSRSTRNTATPSLFGHRHVSTVGRRKVRSLLRPRSADGAATFQTEMARFANFHVIQTSTKSLSYLTRNLSNDRRMRPYSCISSRHFRISDRNSWLPGGSKIYLPPTVKYCWFYAPGTIGLRVGSVPMSLSGKHFGSKVGRERFCVQFNLGIRKRALRMRTLLLPKQDANLPFSWAVGRFLTRTLC